MVCRAAGCAADAESVGGRDAVRGAVGGPGLWGAAEPEAGVEPAPGAEGGSVPTTDAFDPTILLFDAYPGGIGFSDLLFERHDALIASARQLIRACPCSCGCPSCVGPTLEVGPRAKEAAMAILGLLQE